MGRKTAKVEYIPNNSSRRARAKKRGTGAMKKAQELSTLCGVEACLMIAHEDGSSQVWPSLPAAMRTVDRYKSMPEVGQCRRKMDGEDYIRERIAKVQEQLHKAERENRQRENMRLLHDAMAGRHPDLAGLSVERLVSIAWTSENLSKKIKDCIASRGGQLQQAGVNHDPLLYAAATVANVEDPAPRLQQGGVMELFNDGWDLDAMTYNGNHSGSGSSGSVVNPGDEMQLGSIDPGFAWPEGSYFLPGI